MLLKNINPLGIPRL